ncbi:MAG: hypothetical protein LBM93_14310 [Oscillospiraceae bacterium]|jgi:hypothetical protein|nr:hypothetical protein [Oscillospiraceae bacterium]
MLEKDLQEQICNKVTDGWLPLITNKDDITNEYNKYFNGEFYPFFSVDYLIRKNYFEGCQSAFKMLDGDMSVLNGQTIKNISTDPSEKLFPDFLLYNETEEVYIIGELKRNDKTARETITELLAYKTELLNHIPFLGDNSILLLIISTDFPTLLNHAIGNLILRHQPLLCLMPNIENDEFIDFSAYFPQAWSNINQPTLREEQLQGGVYSISLKEEKNLTYEMFRSKLLVIMEFLRNLFENSHTTGISFLCLPNKLQYEENLITGDAFVCFYFVNPYSLLYNNNCKDDLSKFIKEKIKNGADRSIPNEYLVLTDNIKNILNDDFDIMWEQCSSFDKFKFNFLNNFEPIFCNAWGELYSHLLFTYNHKAGRNLRKPSCSLNNPSLVLSLYDFATANYPFAYGFGNLKDFFDFGVKLGAIFSLLENCNSSDNNRDFFNSICLQRFMDLQNSVIEIQFFFDDFNPIQPQPIKSTLDTETINNIEKYIESLIDEFSKVVSVKSELAYLNFGLGLENYALFDEYTKSILPEEELNSVFRENMKNLIDFFILIFGELIINTFENETIPDYYALTKLSDELQYAITDKKTYNSFIGYLKKNLEENPNFLKQVIEKMSIENQKEILLSYPELIQLRNSNILTEKFVNPKEFKNHCDIKYLLDCLKQDIEKGILSAISIGHTGEIGTIELFPRTPLYDFCKNSIEKENKIAVINQSGVAEIVKFYTEQDLIE